MKSLLAILTLGVALLAPAASAQEQQQRDTRVQDTRVDTRVGKQQSQTPPATKPQTPATGDRLEPDDTQVLPSDVSPEVLAARRESLSEERAAILPYYNNFLKTYPLGPEDVISVEVFDQPRYSKAGIVIPPTGRISYMHIKGGISVVGKTTDQVAEEIKKAYEEYIIEPEVTVTLDRAASARYSILGDIAQPGVRLITRRSSVSEAIAEAGGVLPTGDKSKIVLLRRQADGTLMRIPVNLKAIQKGKVADNVFVGAGDQILVPGNKLKTLRTITELVSLVSFARIFTGGF